LSAGLGYAGGTLGREIRALQHLGERYEVETFLLDSVDQINAGRVPRLLQRLEELDPLEPGATIAILGLTYKPGTSTLRRSSALEMIDTLTARGMNVRAFDPLVDLDEVEHAPEFEMCGDPIEAVRDAIAAILIAPWSGMDQFDFQA